MSWSPNFEENLSLSNDLRPTFEQYDQQENYGLTTLRPKNATLNVNEDVYDCPSNASGLKNDVRAVLELEAYRRKFGLPKHKTDRRKWNEQKIGGGEEEEDTEAVETEISNVIRSAGLEREPPSNYRPNSKTTYKAAIPTDKLPVAGRKGLYLSEEDFKFKNPYFLSKPKPEATVQKEKRSKKGNNQIAREATSPRIGDEWTACRKSFVEPTVGVAGEQYVSPAQLYVMKARRNR